MVINIFTLKERSLKSPTQPKFRKMFPTACKNAKNQVRKWPVIHYDQLGNFNGVCPCLSLISSTFFKFLTCGVREKREVKWNKFRILTAEVFINT